MVKDGIGLGSGLAARGFCNKRVVASQAVCKPYETRLADTAAFVLARTRTPQVLVACRLSCVGGIAAYVQGPAYYRCIYVYYVWMYVCMDVYMYICIYSTMASTYVWTRRGCSLRHGPGRACKKRQRASCSWAHKVSILVLRRKQPCP